MTHAAIARLLERRAVKLSVNDVQRICERLLAGEGVVAISRDYPVTHRAISRIRKALTRTVGPKLTLLPQVVPCSCCGKAIPHVVGVNKQHARCSGCTRLQRRGEDVAIDSHTPWADDLDAQALVRERGEHSRPEVAALMGYSAEAIRLIENAALRKLEAGFAAEGTPVREWMAWVERDRGADTDTMGDSE